MPEPPTAPAELYCRDEGTGRPILLLHGLGGDHSVWSDQVRALAGSARVLAPDLRGHGQSPLPDGSQLTFAEILTDLRHLLDGRGIGEVDLVGISAGAFLALQWGVTEPARVRSLVLSGGATHCDAHTRAVGRNWREVYQKEGFDAYFLRLIKDLYAVEWIEANMDGVDTIREQLRKRDLRAAFLWGRYVETFDLRGRFGGFRPRVLVLQGMDDHVVDSSHARLIRQSIQGTQVRLFPLTGHMVPVERPKETSEALAGWISGGGSTGGSPGGEPPAATR